MTEAAAVQKGNNCQVVEVVEVVDVVKVVYATANHIQYITKDNRGLIKKILFKYKSITQPPYKYECINKHNLNDHNDIDLSEG